MAAQAVRNVFASASRIDPQSSSEPRRERRKRESFAPLTLGAMPFKIAGTVAEPAFHEVEEAFFRAGTEPTLQRNEGDEYEKEPGFWQRVLKRGNAAE